MPARHIRYLRYNAFTMIKLFFDIETIPSAEENKEMHVEILKKKSANGTKTEMKYMKYFFEGTFGRICCIGVIKEDRKGLSKKKFFQG